MLDTLNYIHLYFFMLDTFSYCIHMYVCITLVFFNLFSLQKYNFVKNKTIV